MSRYTGAYYNFLKRVGEIETLRELATETSRRPPLPASISIIDALCRSGVVLLSSHIEGYIEELGELAINRIFERKVPKRRFSSGFKYHLSKDLIKEMMDSKEPDTIADKLGNLLNRDTFIWDSSTLFASRPSPTIFVGGFSNPKHEKICTFFNRFGFANFNVEISRSLAAERDTCVNMIDQVVDQRNRIAHGETITVGTPSDLQDMISLTQKYCKVADSVVANWFSSVGCVIR